MPTEAAYREVASEEDAADYADAQTKTASPHHLPPSLESAAAHARLRVSAAYFLSFAGLGLVIASPGPCLLAMAEQTRSNIAQTSAGVFGARAIGYTAGSVVGGASLDAMPTRGNSVLAAALLVSAACTCALPLGTSLSALSALSSAVGLAMGVTDTAANVLMLALHGDGDVQPFMHAQHCFFGLGAFTSPLILMWAMGSTFEYAPAMYFFAAVLAAGGIILTMLPSPTIASGSGSGSGSGSDGRNDSTTDTGIDRDEAATAATDSSGVMRCGGLVLRRLEWLVVGLTAALMAIYVGTEVAFGGFITTYALQYVGLGLDSSKLVTSVYWGSIAGGRLLSTIAAAYAVDARTTIRVAIGGAFSSSLLLCMWPRAPSALWAASCLFGLSLAPIFAWTMVNAETAMDVTGRVATIFIVGAAGGEMVFPAITGALFSHSPLSFPWFILALCVIQAALYVLLSHQTSEAAKERTEREGRGGFELPAAETPVATPTGTADDEDSAVV